jgi:hypothetical protein
MHKIKEKIQAKRAAKHGEQVSFLICRFAEHPHAQLQMLQLHTHILTPPCTNLCPTALVPPCRM